MNVLVVPDKFKGTLNAHTAATLIARGWREARPDDVVEQLPMSDGGDGFGEVLASLRPVDERRTKTVDAAGRPREARWWWEPSTATAIIESAQVVGLALLPPGAFHPFTLDTFGLGAVLRDAAGLGARDLLVGIGGSATNDGGFGLARSLGWQFLDSTGHPIEHWTELRGLTRIVPPVTPPVPGQVTVAVDVQNPFLGPVGASRVYGPQKGLRPEDFALAEPCLDRLADVVERTLGLAGARSEPGTGAAGGLGFGLRCFLNARLESGFALFARWSRLEERIRTSALVLTAEGAIDRSTLMGKGVGEVAAICARLGVPCIGLAGTLSDEPAATFHAAGFRRAYGIVPQLTDPVNAKSAPDVWLPRLAAMAAREWSAAASG